MSEQLTEFKKLPQPSKCEKCLFNKRGLLFVGLFTILVGITAVVSSKIVWPAILHTISKDLIEKAHAIPIKPEIQTPVQIGNVTIITGKRTEISLPKNYNISDRPIIDGEEGWWIYFYWETVNNTDYDPLPPQEQSTGIHWVLRNITGKITLYVRYSVLPTLKTTETGLFVGLSPIEPENFDPFNPPVVFGCKDGRTVFFGIYSKEGPQNFSLSFDVRHDDVPDYDEEIRGNGCFAQSHAERIIRAIYPVMASFFLFCGCICMAYWGYRKINSPETELYQIVGDRPVQLINF